MFNRLISDNKKRNKVLYVCYFATPVILSFVHRCICNKDSDAVLIVYESFNRNNEFEEIFEKVIYANDLFRLHYCNDETIIEEKIKTYYDTILKNNGFSVNDFEYVYVLCDMVNDFAIYLSLYKKNYSFIETHTNQFKCKIGADRDRGYIAHMERESEHGSAAYFKIAQKHHSICSTSEFCVERIFDNDSDDSIMCNENDKKFDFQMGLINLSRREKNILIDAFDRWDIRKICSAANGSTMLLTQRQWMYLVTEEETGLLYEYLCDYFCNTEDRISINPHPSDKYDHNLYFTNAVIFPVGFPSDLFPIVENFSINSAITVSSTSIQKLSYWCETRITCGNTYFRNWRNINKIYYGLKIIETIGYNTSNIYRNSIPDGDDFINLVRKNSFYTQFAETQWISLSEPFLGVALVGEVTFEGEYLSYEKYYSMLLNLDQNSVILFLDLNNKRNFIDFAHYELLDYIYTFKLSKNQVKDRVYCQLNDEYIHIFCKNKGVIAKLFNCDFSKTLPNVGVKLLMNFVDTTPLRYHLLYTELNKLVKSSSDVVTDDAMGD